MTAGLKLISFILSLICPGLGLVLLGQRVKGALIFLVSVMAACAIFLIQHQSPVMTFVQITSDNQSQFIDFLIIILVVLWCYNMTMLVHILFPEKGGREKEKPSLFQAGLDDYIKGDFGPAITKFSQVIRIDPRDAEGLLYLGMSYQKSGQPVKADKLFKRYAALGWAGIGQVRADAQPPSIIELTRQARPLTQSEFSEMKKHTRHGYEILSIVPDLDKTIALIAFQHHERCDGHGYPQGLSESQIDPLARLISTVDIYEALTHTRPHRSRKAPDETLKIMLELKDKAISKDLLKTLIEELSFYPPGTLVQLNTGEKVRVISVNKETPMQPRVLVQTDAQGKALSSTRGIDLSKNTDITITKTLN